MVLNNTNSKAYEKFAFISVLFLLYFSSSFSLSVLEGTIRLILIGILAIFVLFGGILLKQEQGKISVVTFAMLILASISYVVNAEELKYFVILLAYFIISIIFVIFINFKAFANAYVKVMQVVSIVAIVLYALNIFAPKLLQMLPLTENSAGAVTNTIFIAIAPINGRSYGFFWEPGAFQTYLCLAILIEFFVIKKLNKIRIICFIAAMVTTFSTMGYACLIAIVIMLTINMFVSGSNRRNVMVVLCVFLIGLYVASSVIINYFPHLEHTLFGKLEGLSTQDFKDYSSLGVRYNSVVGALNIFGENAVFGVGSTKMVEIFLETYHHQMNTCTPANWFAMFGIMYGLLSCYSFVKFSKYFSKNWVIRILIIAVLLLTISSENYVLNPSVMIWSMYGLAYSSTERSDENEIIANQYM